LSEVNNRISGLPSNFQLVQPHRTLLKEGPVEIITTTKVIGSLKIKQCVLFLFTDVLLWATTDYKYQGHMNIAAAQIKDDENGVNITTSKEEVLIRFKEQGIKDAWITTVSETMEKLKRERSAKRETKTQVAVRRAMGNKRDSLNKHILTSLDSLGRMSLEDTDEVEAAKAAGSDSLKSGTASPTSPTSSTSPRHGFGTSSLDDTKHSEQPK